MIKNADTYAQEFMEVFEEKRALATTSSVKEIFIDTVLVICQRLVIEIKEIMIMRKATSDIAFVAVIKEQDQKWKAIIRRLDPSKLPYILHPDSFQKVWGQFKTQMME